MINITSRRHLKLYEQRLIKRSLHHARDVIGHASKLVPLIYKLADKGTVHVAETKGRMGNMAWAEFSGARLAFVYSHATKSIEVRAGRRAGKCIMSFSDNDTTFNTVRQRITDLIAGIQEAAR